MGQTKGKATSATFVSPTRSESSYRRRHINGPGLEAGGEGTGQSSVLFSVLKGAGGSIRISTGKVWSTKQPKTKPPQKKKTPQARAAGRR